MGCAALDSPPRDDEGVVTPHDHPQICAEDTMLRGIPEQWIHSTDDGGRRISSGAFQRSSDKYQGMSLGAKKILDCADTSVEEWARGRFSTVVCFPASDLRAIDVKVGWDPIPDDRAHCNAWGRIPTGHAKRLAREANRRFFAPA